MTHPKIKELSDNLDLFSSLLEVPKEQKFANLAMSSLRSDLLDIIDDPEIIRNHCEDVQRLIRKYRIYLEKYNEREKRRIGPYG